MEINGKKEIREAVLIAALITFANGVITWGLESTKAKVADYQAKKRKAKEESEAEAE